MKYLLPLLLLIPQETPESALYKKCGSEIAWITDGTEFVDAEQLGRRPKNYKVERAPLLEEAKKKAVERNRLILWWCMRVPGTHMNRVQVLENYMRVVFFSDPGVVDLVNTKFVPLRMCCDATLSGSTGVKRFDFIEPGFVFMTPEGEIVHKIDRIRTFNADWFRAALVAVLRKNAKYNAPAGDSVDDLIRGGDDEKALEKASAPQKALILRRLGRFDEVMKLDAPIQKGLALLNQQKFGEARQVFEKIASAEALYYLAVIDAWTGRDPEPRWKELVEKHAESRWAWRASANLVRGIDSLRDGPMSHNFEDFSWLPVTDAPASTRRPSTDLDATVARAVRFLLRSQRADGSWPDSRYVYCPNPKILPNVIVAMTAMAAVALAEWRDAAPEEIDKAVALAEKYILDESHMNRGENEECYADAYRLLYLARGKDVKRMNEIVPKLEAQQKKNGFWAHEYPNPFATAAVVHCLHAARKAGAEVPEAMLRRAADGLEKTRGDGGRQAYAGGRASSEKNSMARSAMCELALFECGRKTLDDVAAAVDSYWKFLSSLEAIRVTDYHADQELGGFFFFHGVFHSCEAAMALGDEKRKEHLKKFREQMLSIPEIDGSFIDSHELGKSYGTAMALLVLRRAR